MLACFLEVKEPEPKPPDLEANKTVYPSWSFIKMIRLRNPAGISL
jgi:hypothetical protein